MPRSRLPALLALTVVLLPASLLAQAVPPVPVPSENPITEAKRVLGKILFWEEQLSSDNSVACGTCHATTAGGADPAGATHPGADGIFGNADDVVGSAGVVRRDPANQTVDDPVFGYAPQVTGRAAPSFFGTLWSPETFWHGRAGGVFVDPEDGVTVRIASGGALENQAVGPILSPVEMAKEGRTWAEVTSKLAGATPLVFAADLPADVAAALAGEPSYGGLFQDAFGDPAITATRIAFAIATYERTLVADQTPWDAYQAGDFDALTSAQEDGLEAFLDSDCDVCHPPPLFTDDLFTNVGVRDAAEDLGRANVTGLPGDEGKFKAPSLRNGGLKPTYLHTGQFTTFDEIFLFYKKDGTHVPQPNLDPLMPLSIPPSQRADLADFLANALTDPDVAAGNFPFDQPTLSAAGALPVPEPGPAPMLGWGALAVALLARGRERSRR